MSRALHPKECDSNQRIQELKMQLCRYAQREAFRRTTLQGKPLADRVMPLLHKGRRQAHGLSSYLAPDDAVMRAYMGPEIEILSFSSSSLIHN